MLLKQSSADGDEAVDGAEASQGSDVAEQAPAKAAVIKNDAKNPPVFVPLDPFTVNLADRDAERYAQIGITLEIDNDKTGERIKQYMPAIRNNILMAIADRSAGELLGREGKARLADRVKQETARALGYQIPAEEAEATPAAMSEGKPKPKAKGKKKAEPALPIRAVHFSNFIIQ
jgi:flagellar FliL protein